MFLKIFIEFHNQKVQIQYIWTIFTQVHNYIKNMHQRTLLFSSGRWGWMIRKKNHTVICLTDIPIVIISHDFSGKSNFSFSQKKK